MFRTEGSETVKGSMLALTIEAILDFAGERTGHFRLIAAEVFSHDAYGTPRELFIAFFGIIAQTLRDIIGADWSDEIDAAWRAAARRDRELRCSAMNDKRRISRSSLILAIKSAGGATAPDVKHCF